MPQTAWTTVFRAAPGEHLEEVALSDHHVHVVVREGNGQRLITLDPDDGTARTAVFPDLAPATPPGTGEETTAPGAPLSAIQLVPGVRPPGAALDVVRSSWDTPSRWYCLPAPEHGPAVWRAEWCDPTGAFTPRTPPDTTVLTLEAESADGTRIPLTVLRPASHTGPLPTVLYAYGAYGVPMDPAYTVFRPSLLRRGAAFAVAHVRGGGEHGAAWHEAGRGAGKLAAVEDYLACARRLTAAGLTPPGGVVARSRSAGGAVVGAAVNREPGLFTAVLLEVPFVDVLTTLLDPDDPLAALEWDEWGNPVEDPAARAALAALSPVANVRPARYPAFLLTAGLADVRVRAAEPFRLAEAVRAHTTGDRPVLVLAEGFGHLGPSDAEDDMRGEAGNLAFILRETGLVPS